MPIDPDIMALDLEAIHYKACRDEGWSLAETDAVELGYRAFLQDIRNNPGSDDIAPSRTIDRFWHHHILDTAKYMRDCQELFGFYLHHFPYSGVFEGDDVEAQRRRFAASQQRLRLILSEITSHKETVHEYPASV
jgi:hypothetical protein